MLMKYHWCSPVWRQLRWCHFICVISRTMWIGEHGKLNNNEFPVCSSCYCFASKGHFKVEESCNIMWDVIFWIVESWLVQKKKLPYEYVLWCIFVYYFLCQICLFEGCLYWIFLPMHSSFWKIKMVTSMHFDFRNSPMILNLMYHMYA